VKVTVQLTLAAFVGLAVTRLIEDTVGAVVMVRVTAIVCGVLVAPGAAIWIEPLYVPAVSPVMLTEAVSVEGAVVELRDTLSQLPPGGVVTEGVAVKPLSVDPAAPALVILTV